MNSRWSITRRYQCHSRVTTVLPGGSAIKPSVTREPPGFTTVVPVIADFAVLDLVDQLLE